MAERRSFPRSTTPASSTTRAASGSSSTCRGRKSHSIVDQALTAVCCLNHRGAAGAEPDTGDGAGILIQIPDRFYREVVALRAAAAGRYATGIAFLPADARRRPKTTSTKVLADEGFTVLGWRDGPGRRGRAG